MITSATQDTGDLAMKDEAALKDAALLAYILMLVSMFTALPTGIAGVVVAYVKRKESVGSWLEPHFDGLLEIFVKSLVGFGLGALFCLTIIGAVIGIPLLLITLVWSVYRLVVGIVALRDGKAP
jgi:uncharacterized membrane protein